MKTEKKDSHKDTKAPGKNINIYFKTSCLSALVAKKGFTLIEILVVLAIIALLLGILLPALTQIKKLALSIKQKAQISSIEIGLSLYKNDMGEYPPSHGWKTGADSNDYTYSGAHTLAEAMVGYDLLGFDPNSKYDKLDAALYADPNNRKGPYLDRTNIDVYEPNQIFDVINPIQLATKGHMICDVFTFKSKKIGNKMHKIGTPILYFQANLSAVNTQSIKSPNQDDHTKNIYNCFDNYTVVITGMNNKKEHKLYEKPPTAANGSKLYTFIRDPMFPISGTNSCGRPVRTDSFLLISAGWDGLYGTSDDICNFEPNIE